EALPPTPFVPSWLLFVPSWLEEELETELHDPRILCRRDAAERRGVVHRRVGIVEVDGVEQIEDFRAELEVHVVREVEALEQPEVDGRAVRTEELAPARLTERPVGVDGKCRRVE